MNPFVLLIILAVALLTVSFWLSHRSGSPGLRRGALAFGAALLLGTAGYWGAWRFFPLETGDFATRIELWRHGIGNLERDGIHAFVKDGCSDPKNCACVALIHGLGDNGLTWKKLLEWDGWAKATPQDPVRLYAIDLPGSGRSRSPEDPSGYRVRKQAEKLHSWLKPLSCPRTVLVGNSMGGWIAAWLALDHPEDVSKLVLASPAGLKSAEASSRGLLSEPTVESLKEFQRRAYYKPRPIPENVWQAIAKRAQAGNSGQIREAQTEEDFLDSGLGSLHRATLLFWGQADQIIPISVGQQFRALIPGVIWREVPKCGHLPQKECPAELTQAVIDMIKHGVM